MYQFRPVQNVTHERQRTEINHSYVMYHVTPYLSPLMGDITLGVGGGDWGGSHDPQQVAPQVSYPGNTVYCDCWHL